MSKRKRKEHRVENMECEKCKLIIAPTLCFSDIECFEDTVVFDDLCPAPAKVPPLEAKVFVLDFKTRFIDATTIKKMVKFRVFIRYLAENGRTIERTLDRTFCQEVDVEDRCLPDVCADDCHSSFLCRVTDLCVRRACLEEADDPCEETDDIVVEIVGRLSLELFVKQRLCVQLCPEDKCPRSIEAPEMCIENKHCMPCRKEEAESCDCRSHRHKCR